MKETYVIFSVKDSDGVTKDGVFGCPSWGARKALLTARSRMSDLRAAIPAGYRPETLSLSSNVYTDRSKALTSIGAYNENDLDGNLLIVLK